MTPMTYSYYDIWYIIFSHSSYQYTMDITYLFL